MLFDSLVTSHKMEDPEARKPEGLKRASAPSKRRWRFKMKKTSVSMSTLRVSMFVLATLFSVAIIGGLGYLLWMAFKIYVGA